jgi:hypothetical protein
LRALQSAALLVAGCLAISAVTLLAATLAAGALLDRGSPVAIMFIAVATIIGTAAGGRALHPLVTRLAGETWHSQATRHSTQAQR